MDSMPPHLSGYRRDVLTEIQYAEAQLLALAEAVPAEDYGWAPAEDARTFAAVLVHVAAGNLMLLDRAGAHQPEVADFYAGIEGDNEARLGAMIRRNLSHEKAVTGKTAVVDLLARSFAAVKDCWANASEEELWVTVKFSGQLETHRRLYLRIMAHAHEHMGQAIAYVRAMDYRVPWPDPLKKLEEIEATLAVP